MLDVALAAGEEIVDAEDVVALRDQPIAQMRAEKPGAAGDQNASVAHEIRLSCIPITIVTPSNGQAPARMPISPLQDVRGGTSFA